MAASLESRLSRVLDPDVASHVAAYMANIPDRADALEYLAEFIDPSNRRHADLLAELRADWLTEGGRGGRAGGAEVAYMKKNQGAEAQGHKQKQQQQKPQGGGEEQAEIRLTPQLMRAAGPEKKSLTTAAQQSASGSGGGSGAGGRRSDDQFVPLFSALGDQIAVAMLPGRHKCDCVATKHKLVNNCLGCGRIVCEQEGSGPCMYCGELVASKAETEILARGSKKSDQLRRQLMASGPAAPAPEPAAPSPPGLEAALATKQKLLEYDKNSARRTKVIDDQMDYFESDSAVWLSDAERAKLRQREDELRQRRHASRLERRPVYDFAGRRLVEDADDAAAGHVDPEQDTVLREIAAERAQSGHPAPSASAAAAGASTQPSWSADDFPLVNPGVACPPRFNAAVAKQPAKSAKTEDAGAAKRTALRLQDGGLRELRDDGHCLSMHQPWASLLVCGAKRHEGRSWYSAHRGRLWIAATARRPTTEEVVAVEAECRARGVSGSFPAAYPPSCLLGCVHVDEVLPQDEYRDRYPDGESDSPFVFLCSNPQELVLKLPMKGEHKIYRLDPQLHKAATAGLRRAQAASG